MAAALALIAAAAAGCGSSDGRESFLTHDSSGAVFVEWTRTGDELAGSISATEVTQPQAGVFSSAMQPAGQVKQQTQAFTGTVRDASVRLQIGTPALGSQVNGRLEGDALELSIPLDEGVRAMRLTPAAQSDYNAAAQDVRAAARRTRAEAQTRQRNDERAAKKDIERVAVAFQQALDPSSSDDPCRYLTPELKTAILSAADAGDAGTSSAGCAAVVRNNERRREWPLYEGPQGIASIDVTDSLRSPGSARRDPPERRSHGARSRAEDPSRSRARPSRSGVGDGSSTGAASRPQPREPCPIDTASAVLRSVWCKAKNPC